VLKGLLTVVPPHPESKAVAASARMARLKPVLPAAIACPICLCRIT
jgi:hypothetical protein